MRSKARAWQSVNFFGAYLLTRQGRNPCELPLGWSGPLPAGRSANMHAPCAHVAKKDTIDVCARIFTYSKHSLPLVGLSLSWRIPQ